MAIVIEVLGANRRVQHRYFFDHTDIGFGRGYDNDVILDDVHVDAEHAVLRMSDDDQLMLVDNNSINGIRDKRNKLLGKTLTVRSGEQVLLGKTRIRIVDTEHPVPDAITLKVDGVWQFLLNNIYLGFSLLVLFLAFQAYESYLDTINEITFKGMFKSLVSMAAVVVGGATLLSFIGKVIRREWRFNFHLIICGGSLIAIGSVNWFINLISFNYNIGSVRWILDGLILGGWGLLFLWGISRSVFMLKPLHMRVFSIALVCLMVLFSVSDKLFVNPDTFVSKPVYTQLFRPAEFRIRAPITEKEFFTEAQSIFDIDIEE